MLAQPGQHPHGPLPHLDRGAASGRRSAPRFQQYPQELGSSGYYTESFGKWHLGDAFKTRFQRVRADRKGAGEAHWSQLARELPLDRPFFLWLASFDPHVPHAAEDRFRVHDPTQIALPEYLVDTPSGRQAYAAYLDELHRVDYYLGEFLRTLGERGLLENTWVFVLSDNGAPTPFAKATLYDSGIRTPLLVLAPQLRGTIRDWSAVSTWRPPFSNWPALRRRVSSRGTPSPRPSAIRLTGTANTCLPS